MKQIIALAGSNSKSSINHAVLKHIKSTLKREDIEILDLSSLQIPMYGTDEEEINGFPKSILELNDIFKDAAGFILAVPEHNGSIPAFFKNILDWLSRVDRSIFYQKPTILISTSPGGRGGASVLNHLSNIIPYMGADLKGTVGIGNYFDKIENGEFASDKDLSLLESTINNAFIKEVAI